MASSRLLLGVVLLVACKDDDKNKMPDAKVYFDAHIYMDAPPVTGLGQRCSSDADCPANAPLCRSFKLSSNTSPLYCSPACLEGATMTTDAQGNVTTPSPAPDNAKCTAAYTGGVLGGPTCANWLSWTPMDSPFKNSTTYTNITMGCVILCVNGGCPAGLTCTNGGCFPQ
jgi:hypothetical protein